MIAVVRTGETIHRKAGDKIKLRMDGVGWHWLSDVLLISDDQTPRLAGLR